MKVQSWGALAAANTLLPALCHGWSWPQCVRWGAGGGAGGHAVRKHLTPWTHTTCGNGQRGGHYSGSFFFLFLVFGYCHQKCLNCCRTAEARCPPCYDDVLLGTFSGIACQSVTHSHIPLLWGQTAVQVEACVNVSLRVQLKDTTM